MTKETLRVKKQQMRMKTGYICTYMEILLTIECAAIYTDTHTYTLTLPPIPALSSNIIELKQAARQSPLRPTCDVAGLYPGCDQSSRTVSAVLNTTPDTLLPEREREREWSCS